MVRLLGWIVTVVSKKKIGLDIQFGNVGFFSYRSIFASFGSSSLLRIRKIWLSSCYFNPSVRKPIAICFDELQIDINSLLNLLALLPPVSKQASGKSTGSQAALCLNSTLRIISKFGGLYFNNLQVGIHDKGVHIRIERLVPDITCVIAESLWQLYIDLKAVKLKLLDCNTEAGSCNADDAVCIASADFSHTLALQFDPRNVKDIHHASISFSKCCLYFTEEFVKRCYKEQSGFTQSTSPRSQSQSSWPIPKTADVDINDVEISLIKDSGNRKFGGAIKSLHFDAQQSAIVEGSLVINGVMLDCVGHRNLFSISTFCCLFNTTDSILSANVQVENVIAVGHEVEVVSLIETFHAPLESSQREIITISSSSSNFFSRFFACQSVNLTLNVSGSTAAVINDDGLGLQAGFTHFKASSTTNVIEVLHHDAFLEVEVTSAYCKAVMHTLTPPGELCAKQHVWDTALFIGILAGKLAPSSHSCDVMVDSVQVEVSPNVMRAIDAAVLVVYRVVTSLTPLRNAWTSADVEAKQVSLLWHRANIHLQCTNFNVFVSCENSASVMLRCDLTSVVYNENELTFDSAMMKVVYFIRHLQSYAVKRCSDIQDQIVFCMKSFKVLYRSSRQQIEMNIADELFVLWSMGLHMCLHQTFVDARRLAQSINSKSLGSRKTNYYGEPTQSDFSVAFDIRANVELVLMLANAHRVSFATPEICVKGGRNSLRLQSSRLTIACDGHAIVGVELKNINKWRKVIYAITRKPFTEQSPLPPDLLISVKTASLQLIDDPFEVKLRDIYELMCDEYVEQEKRLNLMEDKLNSLQRQQGLLPAEMIETAYQSLSQKATNVYIQRARKLYNVESQRTSLFCWTISSVEIIALADPTHHGRENVVRIMQEIDPDSPFPEDSIDFTTLFCRTVNFKTSLWLFRLRDFPQTMLEIGDFQLKGRLIGAEQVGIARARRKCTVDIGAPWGSITIERNMPPLKFYHSFDSDIGLLQMAYGPCWEPSWAQVNLALNSIVQPSVDPSRPMPFWDKMRLLLHGRMAMSINQTTWLYHASFDPYNTTEFMDWSWPNFNFTWTNANFLIRGDLDVYSKTASKYDDCRVLHLPQLTLCISLVWLCSGDCNDHHSVMPCAPDKVSAFVFQKDVIGEHSTEVHDSYKDFRSSGYNVSFRFEISPSSSLAPCEDALTCLFYNSTMRWIDKLKMCIGRVSRPIRRGRLFSNTVPRKLQLSKHVRNVKVSLAAPKFRLCYWASVAKQNGAEILSNGTHITVGLQASKAPVNQVELLIRRPVVVWRIRQFDSQLVDVNVHLLSNTNASFNTPQSTKMMKDRSDIHFTSMLLNLDKVTYQREEEKENQFDDSINKNAVHRLVIHGLKGAWTPGNRSIVMNLIDSYNKAHALRKNLSVEALKGFKIEPINHKITKNPQEAAPSKTLLMSPMQALRSTPMFSLLQKLVDESASNFVALHEELSDSVNVEQLRGIAACQTNDVVLRNWHVELYGSQVMLRGNETNGYVIASAAKASLLSCDHKPIWKKQQLLSKTTLIGSIECMQYYATVNAGPTSNVRWLTKDDIEDLSSSSFTTSPGATGFNLELSELEGMLASGQCVGGVVSETVGEEASCEGSSIQLQRIVSRCQCQFFYAWFGELDDDTLSELILPLDEAQPDVMSKNEGVDAFTLLHHDLEISTNSLQYATILDIINNLLLYVEPRKKELTEKLQQMRFRLQLTNVADQRTPISQRQDTLRAMVSRVRQLERELYHVARRLDDETSGVAVAERCAELRKSLEETKEQMSAMSEELSIMVSCLRESQLQATHFKSARCITAESTDTTENQDSVVSRRYEVCFKHAEWRMTEADGQIGIAYLFLTNFLYTRVNYETDSGWHQIELGDFKVTNLMVDGNDVDVLAPQWSAPNDRRLQTALRVLCKFKAPVGGISVKEHFEVNVVPLVIRLTARFYGTVMGFFFPGKSIDADEEDDDQFSVVDSDDESDSNSVLSVPLSRISSKDERKSMRRAAALRKITQLAAVDDLDKMKERAAKNKTFLYVKIPEVPLRVSYKSHKEKHILNITDFLFLLPILEYHNQTWTWLDLAMAIKNDCKRVIISQAVQQKLHIKPRFQWPDSLLPRILGQDTEADKAKLLMGDQLSGPKDKSSGKKGLFGGRFSNNK